MNRQEALKKFGPVAVKILGRPVKERAAAYTADYLNRRREQRRGGAVVVPEIAPAKQGNRLFWVGGLAGLVGLAAGVTLGLILMRRRK